MALKSKVFGGDQVRKRLRNLREEVKAPVRRAIAAGALDVATEAKRLVQKGPKTGRTYRRRSVTHQASAPGQPPATDTGFLVSHIHHRVDPDGFGASAISGADYSEHLEFGTVNMGARPFFKPAFNRVRKRVTDRLRNELKKAFA